MRIDPTRLALLTVIAPLALLLAPSAVGEDDSSPERLAGYSLGAKFEPPDGWFVIRRQNGELHCTLKNRREESTIVETDPEHRIKHVQWFHPVRDDDTIERVFARVAEERKAFAAFLVSEDDDASDGEMEYRFAGDGWTRRVHCKAPFFSISIYRVVAEVKEELVVLPRTLGGFTLGEVYAAKSGVAEKETADLPDGTRRVTLTDGNLYLHLAPDGAIIEIGERSPFGSKAGPRFEALKKEYSDAEVLLDIRRDEAYLLVFGDSRTKLRVRGDGTQEVEILVDRALREKYPLPEPKEPPKPPEPEPAKPDPVRPAREDVPGGLAKPDTLGALCGHVLGEEFRAPDGVEIETSARHEAKAHVYVGADGGRVTVGTSADGKVIHVGVVYDDISPALFEKIADGQSKRFGESRTVDLSKKCRDLLNRTVVFTEGPVDRCIDYREGEPGDLLVQVEPALPRGAVGLVLGERHEVGEDEEAEEQEWGTKYRMAMAGGGQREVGVDVGGLIVLITAKRPDPDGSVFRETRKSLTARFPFQIDFRSDQVTCSDGSTVLSMSTYRNHTVLTIYDARTRYDALRVNRRW